MRIGSLAWFASVTTNRIHTMPKYTIVYGPPASGKSLNKTALKAHYKCAHVFDDDNYNHGAEKCRGGVLILSWTDKIKDPSDRRRLLKGARKIPVEQAAKALGRKWITPASFANNGDVPR